VHVGVETRVRKGGEVNRARPLRAPQSDGIGAGLVLTAGVGEFAQLHAQMVGDAAGHFHLSTGDGGAHQIGAGLEPVGDGTMGGRGHLADTLDLDRGGARPGDARPHPPQEHRQILDLRFARRIADHRHPARHGPGEQQVLGRPDAGELQVHGRTQQTPRRRAAQDAVGQLELGAHAAQAVHVHVDRPAPEVVAAGQRHPGLAARGQQRTQDQDRGPHLADQVDGGLGEEIDGHLHLDRVAVGPAHTAHVLQDPAHDLHVEDAGDVLDTVPPRRQQRGDEMLEHGVLGPEHRHAPPQWLTPGDDELVHEEKCMRRSA